jgi:hypothetical protein
MPHDTTTVGLNDNHRRRIFATCAHLDKMLTSIETTVGASSPGDGGPLFHRFEQTLSPASRTEVLAWVRGCRRIIQSVLAQHRISLPPPSDDQQFAIASTLGFMDLDIEELRPEHMKGYGTLDSFAATELESIVSTLREHVQTLAARLQNPTT